MAPRLTRKRIAALSAAILVLFLVVVPFGIAWASLHPSRCLPQKTPGDLGLSYRSVEVKTSDGVALKGWDVDPIGQEKRPIVVVMHGYTSCKGAPYLMRLIDFLAREGYRVVAFDFRGHGESGGTTTIGPREARLDAPAIVGYVREHYPGRPVVLVGYSMGAVVAIMAGERVDAAAVVADSPYTSLDQVVPRWLKREMGIPEAYSRIIGLYGGLLAGESLSFGPIHLQKIEFPLLVVAGTRDPLITPAEAREIAGRSCCGRAIIVQGAGHVEAYKVLGNKYYAEILEFIEQYAEGR